MGKHRAGTKRGGETATARKRRELVKELLISGVSEAEIVEILEAGQVYKGETIKAQARIVRLDLQKLGEDWRRILDDPEVTDREVYAIRERVTRIAVAAAGAKKYREALAAEALLLRLAALRSARWREPEAGTSITVNAGAVIPGSVRDEADRFLLVATRVRSMDDRELLAFVRERRELAELRAANVIDVTPDEEG